jgi:hypothetical protein
VKAIPQNSGEFVYSQIVALTVIAFKVRMVAIVNTTTQRVGRFRLNNQQKPLILFSRSVSDTLEVGLQVSVWLRRAIWIL